MGITLHGLTGRDFRKVAGEAGRRWCPCTRCRVPLPGNREPPCLFPVTLMGALCRHLPGKGLPLAVSYAIGIHGVPSVVFPLPIRRHGSSSFPPNKGFLHSIYGHVRHRVGGHRQLRTLYIGADPGEPREIPAGRTGGAVRGQRLQNRRQPQQQPPATKSTTILIIISTITITHSVPSPQPQSRGETSCPPPVCMPRQLL